MPELKGEVWSRAENLVLPKLESFLLIGGTRFRFRFSSSWTSNSLKKIFPHHIVPAETDAENEHEVIILDRRDGASEGPSCPLPAAGARQFTVALPDGTPVQFYLTGPRTAFLAIGREVKIFIDVGLKRSLILASEIPAEKDSSVRPEPSAYLLPFLHIVLSYFPIYIIHAAAVAWKGHSLLLLGGSGAGKTTMALALARAGLEFMGDDLMIIARKEGRLLSYGFFLNPKVKIGQDQRTVRWSQSDWEQLMVCPKAELGAVAAIRREPGGNFQLVPSAPTTVFNWLFNQSNDLRYYWDPADWFLTATTIANTVPGFVWKVGELDRLDVEAVKALLAP